MTRLTVVMPCLNAETTIGAQLEALAGQRCSESWELVVVDNGSTDRTWDIVESYEARIPGLRLVVWAETRSSPHARNAGCRAGTGELLAFCDADDVVSDGWLQALANALRESALVASRQELARLNPEWLVQSRVADLAEGLQRWPHPPHFEHAATCGLGVRRDLYEALGGFDESLLALYDTDFCFRAQLAGVNLTFVPGSVVHYRFRHSLRGIFVQARDYGRDDALLQRRYRAADDVVRRLLTWPVQNWKPFVRGLPKIGNRTERARLAWVLGWQVGRYEGSIRHRVLAL